MPPPSNKPRVRFLPKPAWKELAEPYQGARESQLGDYGVWYRPKWFWLICLTCGNWTACPYAPFAIRWGMDAPSSLITTHTACISCGGRELTTMGPSFSQGEVDPFPVDRGWCATQARIREVEAKRVARGAPPDKPLYAEVYPRS